MPESRGRRIRSAMPWVLVAAAAVLWVFWSRAGHSGPPEGEPAPELRVPWTQGDAPFDLEAQRGSVVVLAFWATWCPACRSEGPVLSRVQRRLEGSGDSVVGVSIDNHPLPAVASAARGLGMTYPIALATRSDAARFGVELLPTIVVVAPDGRVSASLAGTVGEDRLMQAVERARQEGRAAAADPPSSPALQTRFSRGAQRSLHPQPVAERERCLALSRATISRSSVARSTTSARSSPWSRSTVLRPGSAVRTCAS